MRLNTNSVFVDLDGGRQSKVAIISEFRPSEGQQVISVKRPFVGSTYDPNKEPYFESIAKLPFPLGDSVRGSRVTLQGSDMVSQVGDIIKRQAR